MKILIMGLSGSGKSTLAEQIYNRRFSTWLNADRIRQSYNDWDFSYEGRINQAYRMWKLSEVCDDEYVIIDMIAPLEEIRDIIAADYTIWMNTTQSSQYKDTDAIFEPALAANLIITDFNYVLDDILKDIK